jgi:nitroimidazol reductase NimA-like FMN-containing flavoprotein (pyridoxamine 5'-phosphate oxidase superfamily)
MRRNDSQIHDREELEAILRQADICRIAFAVGNEPYIVALNYGFTWEEKLVLYFHCARAGRKLELLQANDRVCFQLDTDHALIEGERACDWGMKYRSLVGYGRLSVVISPAEKRVGLDLLMNHYGHAGGGYDEKVFAMTEVLKLEVTEVTGKKKGY